MVSKSDIDRLARLETAADPARPQTGVLIVPFAPGESGDDWARRAEVVADGRAVLAVPGMLPEDEWEQRTAVDQRALSAAEALRRRERDGDA